MRFGAALAPRPDRANAPTFRFPKSFDGLITRWAREEGMRPEEATRYLFALSLADVYAVISRRHPEKMENCLRSLKAIGERVGVNVDAIRPDKREGRARVRARRDAGGAAGVLNTPVRERAARSASNPGP